MPSLFKSFNKAIKGSTSKPSPVVGTENGQALTVVTNGSGSLHDAPELHTAQLHPDAHAEGGLACNNDTLLKEQREAITAWITSMGKKIFTGNFNLISTPFPVIMFEPRSYLEKLADVWVYPHYLRQASAAPNPLERMKLVVTWFIAGLHHGFEKWKKPFNPILGETWQATLSDGSRMHMEQISHHPPVTAFNLEGPENAYRFSGLSQPNVAIVLKYYGFKTMAKGFRQLDFPDGSRIDIHYPGYYIKGVVYSTRPRAEVDGSAVFTDLKNGLRAVVRFGPNKGARAQILRRSDAVIGEIYEMSRGAVASEVAAAVNEPTDLCGESSSEIDAAVQRTDHGRASDDDFESASESEWELRELRQAAEEQRDTDSPIATGRHQRSTLQNRVLSDAAAMLTLTAAATGESNPAFGLGPFLYNEQAEAADNTSPQPSASSIAQASMTSQTADPPVAKASDLSVASGRNNSVSKQPEAAPSSSGLLSGFSRMMGLTTTSASATAAAEQPENAGTLLARFEGSWLSHINIDGQRYWTLMAEKPDTWKPVANAIPSDSRFRQDLAMVRQGDIKAAQTWKEELEILQRRDKKLREAGGAPVAHH